MHRPIYLTAAWLGIAFWLATASASLAGEPPGDDQSVTAPALRRELLVPYEELDLLLRDGARRVLLDRAEFLSLLEKARRTAEEQPPYAALFSGSRYHIEVSGDKATIEGSLDVEMLAEGVHALPLPVRGVYLESLEAAGQGVPVGVGDDQRHVVFVTGRGEQRIDLRASAPVRTDAATQTLSIALPMPAPARLTLTAWGDVDLRSGADVVRRVYDEEADKTRFELLPRNGDLTLALTLNSKLRRQERTVAARSVLISELTPSHEFISVRFSLEVLHRAVDSFSFRLPAGFEVSEVDSPKLAEWRMEENEEGRILVVTLREEALGTVPVSIAAFRTSPALEQWTFSTFEPLDAISHVSVLGMVLDHRLRLSTSEAERLVPLDLGVLAQTMPGRVPGAGYRPVLAFFAPAPGYALTASFERPEARLEVVSNLLLLLRDEGLEARGGFVISPAGEPSAEFAFRMPPGWRLESASDDEGEPVPFELFSQADASKVLLRFAEPVYSGAEKGIAFVARHSPGGWLDDWRTMTLEFPVFQAESATRDVGAIALDAGDDIEARAISIEGLVPLDENEKARFGLAGVPAALAYRYDSPGYQAGLALTRATPRVNAETFSFFQIGTDVVQTRYEVIYHVERARCREVALLLPDEVPSTLSIRGASGTQVKEYSSEPAADGMRWTVTLAEAAAERVHLVLDVQMPRTNQDDTEFGLPLPRALDVHFQSGYAAIEGSGDLDIRIVRHPRLVDVGELTEAEYRPGRRLLGAFAFTGEESGLDVHVVQRRHHGLPAALAAQGRLHTVLSANRVWQSRAEFTLQAQSGFLQVGLPPGAELWSAFVDGQPARPQRIGDRIVLDLRSGTDGESRITLVYAGRLEAWGLTGRADLEAPKLRLLDKEAEGSKSIPCADFEWVLTVPSGFTVVSSDGTMERAQWESPPVAALRVARGLYYAAGSVNPRYGLLTGMLSTTQRSMQRGREAAARVELYEMDRMSPEDSEMYDDYQDLDREVVDMDEAAPARRVVAPAPEPELLKSVADAPGRARTDSMRSLQIDLAASGHEVTFRSLGESPELRVMVLDRRRQSALAAGVSLLVLVGGLLLVSSSLVARARYVAVVLAASALLPAIPALLVWAPVFNGAFYAACGLIPLYLFAALFLRWISAWTAFVQGLYARLVPLVLAALALGNPSDSSASDVRLPVAVPTDAVIVPYTDPQVAPGQALIPYDLYERLMRGEPGTEVAVPLRPYALAGSRLSARLEAEDRLELEGWLDIEVFADGPVTVPLPLESAVIAQAWIGGEPARLTVLDAERGGGNQRAVQSPAHPSAGQAGAPALLLPGRGRYRVELVLSAQVQREGGWHRVAAVLPVAPANVLVVELPDAATELRHGSGESRRAHTSDTAERIDLALPSSGRLDLLWRPKAGEGQADRSLFAESVGVLDIQEDRLGLFWQVNFQFRHGEYDLFSLQVPEGFEVEAVEGSNVRGWETDRDRSMLRVELLNPSRLSETINVRLWKPGWLVLDEMHELTFPVLRSPEAIREAGRLSLRRSSRLDVRTEAVQGLRRIDRMTPETLEELVGLGAGEAAFGLEVFQSFEFTALPVDLRVQAAAATASLRAEVQALLRVAELERRLECRVLLAAADGPLHRVSVTLPHELDLREVEAGIPVEWSVRPAEGHQILTVFFSRGVEGELPLTLTGRLGAPGPLLQVPLPHIEVLGAVAQEGAMAVLTDPGFDVRLGELSGIDPVLHQRLHGWLGAAQRELTRQALEWRQPGYGGWVELFPIEPDVLADTITNVRVTDRAVEETTLIDLEIRHSGLRRVSFVLPSYMEDAAIQVPLLREKTVEPLPGSDEVLVTLVLQDEVMQQLRVLVSDTRLLTDGELEVRLPRIEGVPVNRRLLVLESAGRDEVEVLAAEGLEPLGRQQRDWAMLAPVLRGGQAEAFTAPAGVVNPSLRFRSRQRDTVQTAGAGIGLARADIVVDGTGAYRMRQVYHVSNRTEQFLDLRLPEGARLWAVAVAGEPVKPVVARESRVVRIPLVKTAPGDLDYPVELMLGGKMAAPGAGRSVAFPLIRTLNIASEQSQVELRLPRTHRWFAFDGTLRELEDDDQLVAGEIAYQAGLAKRLVQTLEAGNPFEQARARSNLSSLKASVQDYGDREDPEPPSSALRQEIAQVEAVIAAGERRAEEVDIPDTTADHSLLIQQSFAEQRNFYNRNAVLNLESNWETPPAAPAAPTAFNAEWSVVGALVDADGRVPPDDIAVPPPAPADALKRAVDQETFWQANVGMDADQAEGVGQRQQVFGRGRGQAEMTKRYAEELRETQSPPQPRVAGLPREEAAVTVSGRIVESGLASLHVPPLPDDPVRWTTHRFATPRGETELQARAISMRSVEGLQRAAAGILALVALPILLRSVAGIRIPPRRRRRAGKIMVVAACFGILFGILPIGSLVLLIGGIILQARAPRRAPAV